MSEHRQTARRSAARRRLRLEPLEHRRVLSGLPLGAEALDTAEFMLGRVAVTPVFFESTGAASTQDWTAEEIDGVLQKVRQGMQWWADMLDTLDSVHTLEFVYDETYARTPFETSYEPIAESSTRHVSYLSAFLNAQQIDNRLTLQDAARAFNNQQRLELDADWGVTVLVVDASGTPGMFADGRTAFAYAGGAYMVVPSTRPADVFAHEMGHLFWTQDEYTDGDSWSTHRGYYDTQNLNAADNPTPGFVQEVSIMAGGTYRSYAYEYYTSPATTLAFVGWQDSDQDGIFDVLDVPLELQGVASYSAAAQQLEFSGTAQAVALPNRNPQGSGNDITLNRISRIEYRIDGGTWQTALAPDLQVTDVNFTLPLQDDFELVEIRAIDAASGVTSPVISATSTTPGATPASVNGYAFLDEDGDQTPETGEVAIGGLVATVIAADGGSLPAIDDLAAQQYAVATVMEDLVGLTLTASAIHSDGRVAVNADPGDGAGNRFAWYRATTAEWVDQWTPYESLEIRLDELTTRVQVTIAGSTAGARGRLEAYDALGNLLDRDTSAALDVGQSAVLEVQDPANQIARIRVFGHNASEILVTQIGYGPELTATSDAHGVLRFENLPDGTYQLAITPPLVIHEFAGPQSVTVAGGAAQPLHLAVQRIDSPWQNLQEIEDIDDNDLVEPLDALMVINYLNRHGSSPLPAYVADSPLIDADGDGWATPTDALLVVNELNRRARLAGGGQGEQAAGWMLASEAPATTDSDRAHSGRADGDRAELAAEGQELAVDQLLAGDFTQNYLSEIGGAAGPESLGVNGYNDIEPPESEKRSDPLKPFFSEPLRSEGF